MFHLVSLSLQISLTDLPGPCLGLCVGVACFVVFVGLVVGFFLLGKFDLNHRLIPVVDRPCLALVRQCRKKNTTPVRGFCCRLLWAAPGIALLSSPGWASLCLDAAWLNVAVG